MADQEKMFDEDEDMNPILNRGNYEYWKTLAEVSMVYLSWWDAVHPGFTAEEIAKPECVRMDNKAHVRPEYLTDISRLKTSRECWEALEDIHGGSTSMDIAMCMRELGTIEKNPDMDISMYCGKIQALCDKLARDEIELADHVVACFMLAGLATDPYYSTYVRITKIDKNLTSRAVKTELLLEERRIDAAAVAGSSVQGSALAARGQWRRRSYPNKDDAKPKGRRTSDQKCYRCAKWGHISYQCPEEKRDEEKKSKEKERKKPEDNKKERGTEDRTKAKGFI
jgi:hypothetical protein